MVKENKTRKKSYTDVVAAAAIELGNKPPYSPEVEEAVLGAMMIESDCALQGVESLKESSFYDPRMRLIFKAISRLFKDRSAIDVTTVTERLRQDGVLDEVGGPVMLAKLTSNVGSGANIEYYIKILLQKTIQRDLIVVAYKVLKNAFDPTYEVDKLITESQSEVYQAVRKHFNEQIESDGDFIV